jgi:peptide/nickel transport system substrate-binding protein
MKRFRAFAAGFMILALIAVGCSSGSQTPAPTTTDGESPGTQPSKAGGTLTIASAKDAIKLDPGRTNDIPSMNVIDQIFDTLVALNSKHEIVPMVAESWTQMPDGKSFTFTIRKDITFHNGDRLTAEDVAFSFQRILDAPEAASQKRSRISMIEKITVVDPHTVTFDLQYSYAPFIGATRMHIVPKKVVEAVGEEEFAKSPVGSGPFKLSSWRRDDGITLVRNDQYWLKKPNLDRVIFKPVPESTVAAMAVITGEVDIVEALSGQMRSRVQEAGLKVTQDEGMNYYWIGFTQYASPYNNQKFRQMVAHAIDLDAAIPAIFQDGTATRAYGPVMPGLWPRDLETMKGRAHAYDLAKAKQLFEELIAEGVMTKQTQVTFHVNNDPPRQKVAEYAVSSLRDIGVNAQIIVEEWSVYLGRLVGGEVGQMYILGTTPAILDPDAVFNWLYSVDGNHGGVILGLDRSSVDDMLLEARQTDDQARRESLYKAIQEKMVLEQVYHIPAYHLNVVRAVHPRVQDLTISPLGNWPLVTVDANVWVDKK